MSSADRRRRPTPVLSLTTLCAIPILANRIPATVNAQQTSSSSPLSQRETLTLLYNTCSGPQWTNADNWLDDDTSICQWHGIKCSNVNNDADDHDHPVIEIVLVDNNLDCTLPPEVFYLPSLVTLDLGQNPFLDVDFASMEGPSAGDKMQHLRLNDCGLTSLDGVKNAAGINLKSLDVRSNAIQGSFPTEVMSYKRLRSLDLSYNLMQGPLPTDLGTNLFRLRTLLLADNFFTEAIPSSIANATKLQILDISDNALSSTLPSELGRLKRLTLLTVRNQRLVDEGITGPLFDFGELKRIEHLDLSGNGLSGTVPESFLASAKTKSPFMSIDVSGNRLVGTMPQSLSRFQMLRLYLIDNMIDDIAPELCGKSGWFFGEVRQFGCDAILCPRGTYNRWGRQISEAFPCLPCPGGAPNLGSTVCVTEDEGMIDDALDAIGRGNDGRGYIPTNDSLPSNDEDEARKQDTLEAATVHVPVGDLYDVLHDRISPLDPQETPFVREGHSWQPDNSYLHIQRTSEESEFDYSFAENTHHAGASRRNLRSRGH